MSMYKSHLSPEVDKKRSNNESVEQFLARGGKIHKVGETSPKMSVQELMDRADRVGTGAQFRQWLREQGIKA